MTTATRTRKQADALADKADALSHAARAPKARVRKPSAPPTKTDAATAANASVLNGLVRGTGTAAKDKAIAAATAKGTRSRTSTAPAALKGKPAPKPAPKGKAPAKAAPAPAPKADATRMHNQALARRLVDALAAEFHGDDKASQQKVANWVKHLPTGDPTGRTDGAAGNRYWPRGMARPTTADWDQA